MAASKDISGKSLKQGDQVLVPALVPATITAISETGLVTAKTDKPLFGGDKEVQVMAGQAQKWTPPAA